MMFFSKLRDRWIGKPAVSRSPKWPALRDKWLKDHPNCEACGGNDHVVPHHVIPVHDDPSRELDITNLMSLCEHPAWNCHLQAHGGNWKTYRPKAREWAKAAFQALQGASQVL